MTQAVLGGVVGELVLGRKIGGKGMIWGLVFGTLPDLDILFYPWLDQVEELRWHRGISHSILVMVAAAFVFCEAIGMAASKEGIECFSSRLVCFFGLEHTRFDRCFHELWDTGL